MSAGLPSAPSSLGGASEIPPVRPPPSPRPVQESPKDRKERSRDRQPSRDRRPPTRAPGEGEREPKPDPRKPAKGERVDIRASASETRGKTFPLEDPELSFCNVVSAGAAPEGVKWLGSELLQAVLPLARALL